MPSVCLPLLWGLLAGFTLAPATAGAAQADRPWRGEPFSVDAAVLLQSFADSAAHADDEVAILYQSDRLSFDERGRRVIERHLIYQVRKEDGHWGWAEVSAQWDRRRQERPMVAARVISPDGRVTPFDAATLVERSTLGANPLGVYTDAVELVGPLPGLGPGAIVEAFYATSENVPWFDAGTVTTLSVGRFRRVLDAVVVLESPRDLPIRWKVRGARPVATDESRDGDRRRITIDLGPVEAASFAALERLSWTEPLAEVVVATGENWRTVARAYARAVDDTLANFAVPQELRLLVDADLPRLEKIESLLAWIHSRIRYTGVVRGETALLPWAPEKVVARGYGDCKDQSALLVGLLRAAGMEADIALLRTWPAPPIEKDLPGIGSFDHAIVHVGGREPLWVDPTVTGLAVGLIPVSAQGRRALICNSSTSGLVEIPRHDASSNVTREVRSLRFPDFTFADVVETTEAHGLAAVSYRETYAERSSDSIESSLSDYVKGEYTADSLRSWSLAAAEHLSAPFELRIEAAGVKLAGTGEAEAWLRIPYRLFLDALPPVLLSQDELQESRDLSYPDEVRWEEVYRREIVHRLQLPPGFVVREIPAPLDVTHGPIHSSIVYDTDVSTGEFVVRMVVEAERPAMDLDDAIDLAELAGRLREVGSETIYFDHAGELLRKKGDLAGAIASFRREIADRPSDPIARARLSSALLEIGLGEAARAAARRGMELDDDNDYVHRILAEALAADALGRELAPGMDRLAAIEAARYTVASVPGRFGMYYMLGRLLEVDDEGRQFGEGWDPAGAMEAFVASLSRDSTFDSAQRLLDIAGREGRWVQLDSLVAEVEDESAAHLLRTTTRAVLDGPLAAQREAHRGVDAERAQAVLGEAGFALLRARNYERATEVFELTRHGSDSPRDFDLLLSMLRAARKFEESEADFSGPEGVCRQLLLAFIWGQNHHAGRFDSLMDPLIQRLIPAEGGMIDTWPADLRSFLDARAAGEQTDTATLEVGIDIMMSTSQWRVDSDGWNGYQVRMVAQGPLGPMDIRFLVVERDGTCRILGILPDVTGVALRALECVEANRLDAARKWIEWAGPRYRSHDPKPLESPPMHRALHIADLQDPVDVRRVAIALLSQGAAPVTAIEFAEAALAETTDSRWQSVFLESRFLAGRSGAGFDRNYELLQRLFALHPQSEVVRQLLTALCVRDGRFDEAESLLAEVWTDEAHHQRVRSQLLVGRGDIDGAIELLEQLIASGRGEDFDRNNLAWYRMSRGEFDDTILDMVLKSIAHRGDVRANELHSLACAYAERGQLVDAYQTLLEGLHVEGTSVPDDKWSFVLARIAEHAGETEFARRIYESIAPSDRPGEQSVSTRAWADRRLRAMQEP